MKIQLIEDFALESVVSAYYPEPSQRALGMFLIHLRSQSYGLRESDASLLAASYDAVRTRVRLRGSHVLPGAANRPPEEVALTVYRRIFRSLKRPPANAWPQTSPLWAPDGDAAFDDGSFVIHLDVGPQVRLIGFRLEADEQISQATLTDLLLPADPFYETLQIWADRFLQAWEQGRLPFAGAQDSANGSHFEP